MGTSYVVRPDCRLCSSEMLRGVLALEPTPLANEFLKPGDSCEELFPLHLVECLACGHVQLPVVVDPERLFRNYVYVSGTSPAFVEHFRRYANDLCQAHNLAEGSLVVEIGSNDGTLLKFFKQRGMRVLGVDPAAEIAAKATAEGVPTIPHFFRESLAEEIVRDHGRAALVVANNVFAHADDLSAIVRGVKTLLAPGAPFVFEVQYLGDLLDGGLFDMIYHEHLSYHSVRSLVPFFRRHGMTLFDVKRVNTHGGSIRCRVFDALHVPLYNVDRFVRDEGDVFERFRTMQTKITERGDHLRKRLGDLRTDRKVTIAGYGAPAKATTLTRQFGLTGLVDFVVDDSPWKQGLCMPGSQIPVYDGSMALNCDVLVLFAWNFAEPILAKLRSAGFFDGQRVAIVPLPEYQEIRS